MVDSVLSPSNAGGCRRKLAFPSPHAMHMHMHLHYSYNFIHMHACVYILTSMTCMHEKFKGKIFHGYIT